jgi:NSS family neurotransmitter:Na+ symporter
VTVLAIIACCGSLLFSTGISSYLVEVVDTFVNEFGILILIALQAIIFTRYVDVDELRDVLNKNSAIKVGKKWKFDLKYILPAMLIVMWIIGVGQLIYEVDLFKLGIYVLITFLVLVLSVFFTRLNPIHDKE